MGYFRWLALLAELLSSAGTPAQPDCILRAAYGRAKDFLGTVVSAGRRQQWEEW